MGAECSLFIYHALRRVILQRYSRYRTLRVLLANKPLGSCQLQAKDYLKDKSTLITFIATFKFVSL